MMRLAIVILLVGCDAPPLPITDYDCPPQGTPLTYESFARGFFDANCNGCHSAEPGYRHGAPSSYRFDTLADIQLHAPRIFIRAAATNKSMPLGPNDPPLEDRDNLADYLACGTRDGFK